MQLTKFTLTDDLFTEMKQRVDISLQEKTRHNHHLAGNILGEYLMDANFPNLEQFLIECIESNNWYATYLDEEFKKYLRTLFLNCFFVIFDLILFLLPLKVSFLGKLISP